MNRQILPICLIVSALATAALAQPEPRHFRKPDNSDRNMSIIIESLTGLPIVDSAEVACITPTDYAAGVEVIMGDAPYGMGVMAYYEFDRGDTVFIVDGFRPGQPLKFLYWDPVHDWELEVDVVGDGDLAFRANNYPFLSVWLTLGVDDPNQLLPVTTILYPAYPNPFNSTSAFRYELASPGLVEVTLLDLRGAQVRHIVDGMRSAGNHTGFIDASGLTAGSYILALKTPSGSVAQRIVLLK